MKHGGTPTRPLFYADNDRMWFFEVYLVLFLTFMLFFSLFDPLMEPDIRLRATLVLGLFDALLLYKVAYAIRNRFTRGLFYEDHAELGRGKSKRQLVYSDVLSVKLIEGFFHSRSPYRQVSIQVKGEGRPVRLMGDPRNGKLNTHLSEWLAERIGQSPSEVQVMF